MEKDNKMLVGAILVFLALFLVSFKFDGITGNVVKNDSKTSIIISPEAVSVGGIVQINVIPGSEGVNQKTSFIQAEDNLRKTSVSKLCNNYKCSERGSFSFVVPSNWERGIYYVQVYDYGTKNFVLEDFTVI